MSQLPHNEFYSLTGSTGNSLYIGKRPIAPLTRQVGCFELNHSIECSLLMPRRFIFECNVVVGTPKI